MKIKLFLTSLLLLGITAYSQIQKAPGACGTCNDSENNISHVFGDNYSATIADAYYWEICEGSAVITGSNKNRTISVDCSSGNFTLKLTQFINGNCVESCETYECGDPICKPSTCLSIVEVENCIDYQAWMNCNDPTIDHINWFYTISGSYVHIPFGTSYGNSNGQHAAPLAGLPPAPSGSWDNYNLYVFAEVVYDNGYVCDEIMTYITLDCGGFSGEKNRTIDRIKITPNPSNGIITLTKASNSKIENLIITNFSGEKIKYIENNFGNEINMSNERDGIYFIRINFSDGSYETKKIILSK